MKNVVKKLFGMATAAIMSVSMVGALPAAAEEATEDIAEYSTIEEYIEFAIPHYIRAQSVEINGTFYYSNTIDIYDINDIESGSIGDCVFLFDDDEIIGKMQVWKQDGEYVSVFDTHITDEIQGSFDDNYAIAFGYFEEDFYSYDEIAGSTFIDGRGSEECPDYELPLNEAIGKAATMDLAAIPVPYASSASLDVLHVRNQQNDYGDWLCWAACVAMMVNYRDGTSLTAQKVWRAMVTNSNPNPIGDFETEKGAFDKYNYDYTLATDDGGISASEVMGALSSDKPIFMAISGTTTSGKPIGHAVVICGITIENATSSSADITLTVNDPERTKLQSITAKANPSKVIKSIYHELSSSSYNKWTKTIY